MEHFAADGIKAERAAAIRGAINAKVPIYDIVRDYDTTLEEVMRVTDDLAKRQQKTPGQDDWQKTGR